MGLRSQGQSSQQRAVGPDLGVKDVRCQARRCRCCCCRHVRDLRPQIQGQGDNLLHLPDVALESLDARSGVQIPKAHGAVVGGGEDGP